MFGNPVAEISGNLTHLGEGLPKIRDGKFLDNMR